MDVLILTLNETNVVLDSIKRLKKEKYNIVVVDNGSDEEQKQPLREVEGITLVDLDTNNGSSVGRNRGIDKCTGDFIFLLDGDILYIPRTIENLLENYPEDAGCVGVHNRQYWNGTQMRDQADLRWPKDPGELSDDFDMAWTQYGLFRGDVLRDLRFHDRGIFGKAGVGYEDDWLFHDMRKHNWKSYYYPKTLYYHEAHGGRRYLESKGLPINDDQRREVFMIYWRVDPNKNKGQNQQERRLT